MYKEKKARREYRKLYKRFELGKLKEDDYVHLYTTYNLPFDSIILLASTFLHKGDFNKAITVYLALLEHVTDRVKKEELLELLGTTYFKGGFLQRSKDIFLKILKFSPRNRQALTYLLLVYEKLKEYDKAKEVIESLDELKVNMETQEVYIDALKLSIKSDVRNAVELLVLAQKALVLLRSNSVLVKKNRDLVEMEYSAGQSSLVRLNEAQRDMTTAQSRLALSLVTLRKAWFDLEATIGKISKRYDEWQG